MELQVLPMGLSQNKSPSLFCLQGFFFFYFSLKWTKTPRIVVSRQYRWFSWLGSDGKEKRHTITLKAPHLHPPNLISLEKKKRRGSVKEKRRCNYHKHRLRDQLHFKETRALCPRLHTAPSISAVRVGKHEQITRLLIAARSEEVSTLLLPGRNSLSPAHSATSWKSTSAQELYLNSASCSRGRAHNAKPTAATQRHKHTFCNCASPCAVAAMWT